MPESNDKPDSDKSLPGLPADWAMSHVTRATPRAAATQPAQPAPTESAPAPRIEPVAAAAVEHVAPSPRPAPADSVAPQTLAVDPMVFGALGQWQERVARQEPDRRTTSSGGQRMHGAMLADGEPVIHYAPPVNPPAAPVVEVRPPQPQPQPRVKPVEPAPVAQQPAEPQAEPETTAAPAKKIDWAVLLSSLHFWRAVAGVFIVISVVLAVLLSSAGSSFEVGLAPIGQVNSPAPVFLVESGKTKLRLTPLADIEVPKDRDLQLWMFQPNSERAISLGVLPVAGGVFTPPATVLEGARFVISLEPHGGTTNGRITGNVLYGGLLANR